MSDLKAYLIRNFVTDEELIQELSDQTRKFTAIKKSCAYAKSIMEDYKIPYFSIYNSFMAYFLVLASYAKERGITVPKDLLNTEITNEDIVKRLEEQRDYICEYLDEYLTDVNDKSVVLLPFCKDEFLESNSEVFEAMIADAKKIDLSKKLKRKKRDGKIRWQQYKGKK